MACVHGSQKTFPKDQSLTNTLIKIRLLNFEIFPSYACTGKIILNRITKPVTLGALCHAHCCCTHGPTAPGTDSGAVPALSPEPRASDPDCAKEPQSPLHLLRHFWHFTWSRVIVQVSSVSAFCLFTHWDFHALSDPLVLLTIKASSS